MNLSHEYYIQCPIAHFLYALYMRLHHLITYYTKLLSKSIINIYKLYMHLCIMYTLDITKEQCPQMSKNVVALYRECTSSTLRGLWYAPIQILTRITNQDRVSIWTAFGFSHDNCTTFVYKSRRCDMMSHLLENFGAGGRTRTPDLLITSQLHYQLCYTSVLHNECTKCNTICQERYIEQVPRKGFSVFKY